MKLLHSTSCNLPQCHDSSVSGLVSVGSGLSMLSLSRMAGHPATARMMVLAAKVAAPTMPLTSTEQDTLKALVGESGKRMVVRCDA